MRQSPQQPAPSPPLSAPQADLAEEIQRFLESASLLADFVPALIARYPVTLREDTPEQQEMAITPAILETLYEAVAWPHYHNRQDQGSFHTPTRLAFYMARESLAGYLRDCGALPHEVHFVCRPFEPAQPVRDEFLAECLGAFRAIDLSVGPGSFLVALQRILGEALVRLPRPNSTPTLVGQDKSALAVAACQARMLLAQRAWGVPASIRICDSLTDSYGDEGTYHLSIGNPPYLRDSRKKDMPPDLPRRYRAATSHYDLYVLFMERSLHMLRAGGRLCLLTSNRYLSQKYGRGIRELLLEHRLEAVLDLQFKTFDAGVTTCITMAQKGAAPETVCMGRIESGEPLPCVHPVPTGFAVPQSDLGRLPGSPFRIGLRSQDVERAHRITVGTVPLREVALVTLGMVFHDPRPGGKRKADYLSADASAEFSRRLVDGEHVARFDLQGGLWLDYRPHEHREPRFMELFAAPKVLCRRIIGRNRIMAYLDEGGLFFSDNVVGVVPYHWLSGSGARVVRTQATKERVERSRQFRAGYLTALLNSRLFTWYYRTLLGFNLHLYPEHLKQLPIAPATDQEQERLAALVAQRQCGQSRAIDGQIDEMVESLYQINCSPKELERPPEVSRK